MIKLSLSHHLPAVFDDEPMVDGICHHFIGPASIHKNQFNSLN